MNYDRPELVDALAREYVLGTLQGPARRRFRGLAAGNLAMRRAIRDWETRLTPLAFELAAVEPPERVWAGIQRSLDGALPAAPPQRSRRLELLAAGLAVVALTFSVLFFTRGPDVQLQQPDYVVVIADEAEQPLWLIQAFAASNQLRITTINPTLPPTDRVYELWMLPDDGSPPLSLGLITAAVDSVLALTADRLALLARSSTLAVSLEPPGGSPTGAPTGPVVFTAPLIAT